MLKLLTQSSRCRKLAALVLALATCVGLATTATASKKKKKAATAATEAGPHKFKFDPTKLVWPAPPNVARVKWQDYFAGMKIDYNVDKDKKKKQTWMDRLAGTQSAAEMGIPKNYPFQMIAPYGLAVDSKGLIYAADQKVGAVFIFDPKTHGTQMIRNGYEAKFNWINGLAMDDDDRLFVSDCGLHHILVFNPQHQVEGIVNEGLVCPVGLALDTENRFLYAADTEQDQVLVFDADSFKLLRRIGTGGKNHYLTSVGDFAAPQGVAVDKDGNLYVTDTLNNRVEIFDADGEFVSLFGRHGDGPGDFARPKGIAIDGDGHIWVADEMTDRLQAFNRDGQLLTYIGIGHGDLPGQFKALVGVTVDKENRIITSEQLPGRVQVFQYVTEAQAVVEKEKEEAEREKAAEAKRHGGKASAPAATAPTPGATTTEPATTPAATTPAPGATTPAETQAAPAAAPAASNPK